MHRKHSEHRVLLFVLAAALASGLLAQPALAQDAADLIRQAGVKGGLIVHLGCTDGRVTTGR